MYDTIKPYKKQIIELIKQTWETPYVSVKQDIVKKKFIHQEYHHTDVLAQKEFTIGKKELLKTQLLIQWQ